MNQFTINVQPSDTLWYTPMEHKTYPFFYPTNNNNYYQTPHHNLAKFDDVDDSDNSSSNANADRSDTTTSSTTTANPAVHDKEHMFEKPLTPSDVGKLNRLVIPKQHAEKYFPLAGVSVAAAAANTTAGGDISGSGGVLLGFEDEGGKCWRFRYSYWNSSQSYVLTKGWSRYVKEKKLDAGDVVLFERHRFDPDRFFIGWRRRGSNPVHHVSPAHHHQAAASAANWTASRSPNSSYGYNNYHNHHHHHQNTVQLQQDHTTYAASHQITPASYSYQPETLHPGTEVRQRAKKSGSGNSKRVRLFGVNLECQLDDNHDDQENDDEPQTSDGSSLSSQGHQSGGFGSGSGSGLSLGPTTYNNFDYMGYHPTTNHHNHMDMNFPHDVNQMRNRLG